MRSIFVVTTPGCDTISNEYLCGNPSRLGFRPYPLLLEWLTVAKYSSLVDLAKFLGSFHVFEQGVWQ
jgi:hypothetical protein